MSAGPQQLRRTSFPVFSGSDIDAIVVLGSAFYAYDTKARAEAFDQLFSIASAAGPWSDTVSTPVTSPLFHLLSLQTISLSSHRALTPTRALGTINPRSWVRGARTLAGTLVLNESDRDPFRSLLTSSWSDPHDPGAQQDPVLPDQLPVFDLMLLMANEEGAASYRYLAGVRLSDMGTVYSTHDPYSEQTMSYVARTLTPLLPLPPADRNDHLPMEVRRTVSQNLSHALSASELARRRRFELSVADPFR